MFQLCKQENSVSRSRRGKPEEMLRRYEIIYTQIPTVRTVRQKGSQVSQIRRVACECSDVGGVPWESLKEAKM